MNRSFKTPLPAAIFILPSGPFLTVSVGSTRPYRFGRSWPETSPKSPVIAWTWRKPMSCVPEFQAPLARGRHNKRRKRLCFCGGSWPATFRGERQTTPCWPQVTGDWRRSKPLATITRRRKRHCGVPWSFNRTSCSDSPRFALIKRTWQKPSRSSARRSKTCDDLKRLRKPTARRGHVQQSGCSFSKDADVPGRAPSGCPKLGPTPAEHGASSRRCIGDP